MEQPQYNMLCRQRVESEYVGQIELTGMGLTIFSPLKTGILTGKYNDGIPPDSRLAHTEDAFIKGQAERIQSDETRREIETVRKLKPIADKLGITQTTLAYAWVLRNKNISSAITGASRPEQVYESVKAIDAYKLLTDEIVAEIDGILNNKPTPVTRRFL
jgi:aryl-alcohol dehydrogenase-like predicted oxidoreductase